MDAIVFEQRISAGNVSTEDGGMAKTVDVSGAGDLFVRLQSWNEGHPDPWDPPAHPQFDALVGRRVRVTVEVVD